MAATNKLPASLLKSLQGIPGFDAALFEETHESGRQVTSLRINPAKKSNDDLALQHASPVPWSRYGYYLPERPSFTADPSFHAGAYYVQEASSMFLEQLLLQTTDTSQPITVLDLCAAPGGKSTHLQSLLNARSVLVSNEVIRNRVTILTENITKWGAANCIVTNNDPKDFSALKNLFDVIVVDAPCSGSGLFRKDNEAIEEWSLQQVEHCSLRQQRIISDVWPALKPGGILIYSTCSYSLEEDENITDRITATTGAASIEIDVDERWGIVQTLSPVHKNSGYRFYPYLLDGEGFFISCFKKTGDEASVFLTGKKNNVKPDKKLEAVASQWVQAGIDIRFYRHELQLFAMLPATLELFLQLQQVLNIRKAGVKIGDMARDEIVPDHALALSVIKNHELPLVELEKEQALDYLRRVDFETGNLPRGWIMAGYRGLALGWIKSLGNRINNYYPKEWRIRSK